MSTQDVTGAVGCERCTYWEPDKKNPRQMASIGYCPIFDKRTSFDHGKQCTAWRAMTLAKAAETCAEFVEAIEKDL